MKSVEYTIIVDGPKGPHKETKSFTKGLSCEKGGKKCRSCVNGHKCHLSPFKIDPINKPYQGPQIGASTLDQVMQEIQKLNPEKTRKEMIDFRMRLFHAGTLAQWYGSCGVDSHIIAYCDGSFNFCSPCIF